MIDERAFEESYIGYEDIASKKALKEFLITYLKAANDKYIKSGKYVIPKYQQIAVELTQPLRSKADA